MKLTIINGSPRGLKSTTSQFLKCLKEGFLIKAKNNCKEVHLTNSLDDKINQLTFISSDIVIIGFPLYTDAMPGLVKEFIESLEPICKHPNMPKLGFLIQSGFPEAKHSYYVERYCKKLSSKLGCEYLGSIIRGNGNRIEEQPKFMTEKLFKELKKLGETLGEVGKLDSLILKKLLVPETLSFSIRVIFRLMNLTPLGHYYWKKKLKESKQYQNRYAKPYYNENVNC